KVEAHGPAEKFATYVRGLIGKAFQPFLARTEAAEKTAARNRAKLALSIALAIAGSLALPLSGLVILTRMPYENKAEFQIVVDMPAGTPVEATAALLRELGAHLATVPEVTNYQAYAGLPAPISFNGLVRQYYLREGGQFGDIQVNLVDRHQR